jgi:AhpD family alkylhydroperoxidase
MATQVRLRQRIDLHAEWPKAWDAMVGLEGSIELEQRLRVLVKLRASLLNGCVYCIDLHGREGLEGGERQERLFGLAAWRESPYFTERERAALALTDAITIVAQGHVSGEVWAEACRHLARESWPGWCGPWLLSTAGTGSRSRHGCRRRATEMGEQPSGKEASPVHDIGKANHVKQRYPGYGSRSATAGGRR